MENVQTPGTAAKRINEIALKNFKESSKFRLLPPHLSDRAIGLFKQRCFIKRGDYMRHQMKQYEQLDIPKLQGGKLVYSKKDRDSK